MKFFPDTTHLDEDANLDEIRKGVR